MVTILIGVKGEFRGNCLSVKIYDTKDYPSCFYLTKKLMTLKCRKKKLEVLCLFFLQSKVYLLMMLCKYTELGLDIINNVPTRNAH